MEEKHDHILNYENVEGVYADISAEIIRIMRDEYGDKWTQAGEPQYFMRTEEDEAKDFLTETGEVHTYIPLSPIKALKYVFGADTTRKTLFIEISTRYGNMHGKHNMWDQISIYIQPSSALKRTNGGAPNMIMDTIPDRALNSFRHFVDNLTTVAESRYQKRKNK